jgi:hypothetical protein
MVHKHVGLETGMCFGLASILVVFYRYTFHLIRLLLANQSTDVRFPHSVNMRSTSWVIVFAALATGVLGHVPAQSYGASCMFISRFRML